MTLISAAEATNLSNQNHEVFNDFKERVSKNIFDLANNGLKSTFHNFPPNTSKELVDDFINELSSKGYKVQLNGGSSPAVIIQWD